MKISLMTNDQACEAMIRLSQPLANIIEDENLKPILNVLAHTEGKPIVAVVATMLPKVVSLALKEHKQDVYEIVGALTFQHTNKVAKMNFMATLKELKESIDEDFLSFFKSSETVAVNSAAESE